MPIPVWIALAVLPLTLFLSTRRHRGGANVENATGFPRAQPPRRWLYRATATVYYLLIVANILMQTLEIVRLALIHFGIGLLPFSYVGLLLGGALHWTRGVGGRIAGWEGVNAVLWIGGMVMTVVKTVGLVNEGIHGRKGSKYPVVDQVTDVAVIAGVYLVIQVLEVALGVWRRKSRRANEGMVGK